MNGRKAVISLSLLCSLLACAFAAQSALAASATNTTAATCVKVPGGTGEFADPHCDEEKAGGQFAHEAVSVGLKTNVVATNAGTQTATTESTSAVFKGDPFKTKTEITCQTVGGEGTLTNEEPEAAVHKITGSILLELTECKVQSPAKCTAKQPILINAQIEGVEGLGAGKNEMGVEFRPTGGGKVFGVITLEGAECVLKGKPFNVEGAMIATGGTATQTEEHSGATGIFTNAMTSETLTAAERKAELSLATTLRRFPKTCLEEFPITLTTTT